MEDPKNRPPAEDPRPPPKPRRDPPPNEPPMRDPPPPSQPDDPEPPRIEDPPAPGQPSPDTKIITGAMCGLGTHASGGAFGYAS